MSTRPTSHSPTPDVYSAREIARAVGVSEGEVLTALGVMPGGAPRGTPGTTTAGTTYLRHDVAVQIGRALRQGQVVTPRPPFFALFDDPTGWTRSKARTKGLPLALSSTLHAGILAAAVFITTFGLTPTATALRTSDPEESLRLVFLAIPGPGGGGGGGGLLQRDPAPNALREGHRTLSSPLPARRPPKAVEPALTPPEPKVAPPLQAEQLPMIVAPIVTAPGDARDRIGVLTQTTADADSHGSGKGGGAGTGAGTGLGPGEGSGIGPGSGGGTGGGPYRPGSGIDAPRLQREVRADYTEEARQRGLGGEVVLEIVVRTDGTVGDVKVLQGLGAGLDERAVQAVRQWRFSPARRQGTPVDVIVEVAVEFRLR